MPSLREFRHPGGSPNLTSCEDGLSNPRDSSTPMIRRPGPCQGGGDRQSHLAPQRESRSGHPGRLESLRAAGGGRFLGDRTNVESSLAPTRPRARSSRVIHRPRTEPAGREATECRNAREGAARLWPDPRASDSGGNGWAAPKRNAGSIRRGVGWAWPSQAVLHVHVQGGSQCPS